MKQFTKNLVLALLITVICLSVNGQTDSTSTGSGGADSIIDKIINNLAWIIPTLMGIYELIARLFPTVKDWSMLNKIIALIQLIADKFLPNKNKEGTTHENAIVKNVDPATIAKGVEEAQK